MREVSVPVLAGGHFEAGNSRDVMKNKNRTEGTLNFLSIYLSAVHSSSSPPHYLPRD